MKTNQSYVYTGSTEYTFDNIVLDETRDVSFDASTNNPEGIDTVPYDGAVVTMKSGAIGGSGLRDMQPSLGNRFYYLITNKDYNESEKDTVISLATEVPVSIVSGKYEGTFVFSNPNNYKNLYLIWDYTNKMPTGTASFSGGDATNLIDIDFGTDIGISQTNYNITDVPARISLKWSGTLVGDTGYVGLNSIGNYNALIAAGIKDQDINLVFPYDGLVNNGVGNIQFKKTTSSSEAQYTVESPLASTKYSLRSSGISLKSFFIDTTDGTPSDVCNQCPTTTYYHNGEFLLPEPGDIIYTASDGSSLYDGANAYHLIDTVTCPGAPIANAQWITVNSEGLVTGKAECNCTEFAVPFISQDDLSMATGRDASVSIDASGNPTSWTIVSTCIQYSLNGGLKGSIFTYTDCNGSAQEEVVGARRSVIVSGTVMPVVKSGDGTVTNQGVSQSDVLPDGLLFDTLSGELSGSPTQGGSFTLSLTADNCFGTSAQKDIGITVATSFNLKPFTIDLGEPQVSGDAACALEAFSCILMYHNGENRVPDVGDTTYCDPEGIKVLNGSSYWYYIENST